MEIEHKDLKVSVVRWTIDDFFGHVNKKTEHLYSEDFKLDGLDAKFYLKVYMSKRLNFSLRVSDMGDKYSIRVDLKFWLENKQGKTFVETPGRHLYIIKNVNFMILVKSATLIERKYDYGFREVLNRAELESTAAFFGNRPAVVCCEITRQVVVDGPEPPKIQKALRESLWKCYKAGLSDSIIIQVEGKEFKVS
jgi:hypothetical protein